MIFESEQGIYLVDQLCNALDLVLICSGVMKICASSCVKAAYTHQSVKLTRFLMTVNDTELTHTERQITVGTRLRSVNQNAARAVHRFDGVILVIDHSCIHVVFIMIPVPESPRACVSDDRSGNLYITSFFVDLSPVIKQVFFSTMPFGRKNGKPDLHRAS